MWLVNAGDVKNVPGRPETDRLDAVWLAKLAERGMVRASFVPPEPVRRLRDLTRLRTVLTEDRARYMVRVEKVLEDAQIKLSSEVSELFGVSGRAMLDALVAGERRPATLAALAKGRLIPRQAALTQALTGRFIAHHADLVRIHLENIDRLAGQVDRLTTRIDALIAELDTGSSSGPGPDGKPRTALPDRLDGIPGLGRRSAQNLLAETGFDMDVWGAPKFSDMAHATISGRVQLTAPHRPSSRPSSQLAQFG